MEQQLAKLNVAQRDSVLQTEGPLLVLAGAGTGKTRVLTTRIIHIINSYLAAPAQILAVTFTNKAAAEMKKRISDEIGDAANNLWIGTFHSIAARITRRHAEIVGLKSDFTIIDQDDQTRLLKQIIADFNIDAKQFPAKNYLNKISRMKDLGTASALQAEGPSAAGDNGLPKFREIFNLYQYRLKSMNAADFGDLLAFNLEIFKKAPEVLASYQERFYYILVDEYQDTNNVQYQWLLLLASQHCNLCAVGDDDQSIYSWRGANIANILRFEKDFANATVIRLEQNYRSTGNILKAADSVISHNKERHGKTLWTDAGQGEPVKLLSFIDDRSEAATIVETIAKFYRQKKYKLSESAILVRAGYQTRAFEEAFIRASLPYRIIGGLKFYERMEVKDAICYLRTVANPHDDLAFSRIINVPKRGVGETTINTFYQKSRAENISLFAAIADAVMKDEVKGKAKDALKTLVEQIVKWRSHLEHGGLPEAAKLILMESGYIQMWQSENSLEAQGRLENIDEFASSLADFSNITEFLEYVSLVEAKEDKNAQDCASVMTVHAAKGLEFDLVFIPGLEDSVFPSARSVEERNGLEEERRLFYVAITRAKKELFLSYAKTRFVFGDYQAGIPSRFLKELPSEVAQNAVEQEDNSYSQFSRGGFSGGGSANYSAGARANSATNYSAAKQHSATAARPVTTTFYKAGNAPTYATKTVAPSSSSLTPDTTNALFGKRMFHQKFGYGKVVGIDGSKLDIVFEKAGRKVVLQNFVAPA